jgi:hypothetical protein
MTAEYGQLVQISEKLDRILEALESCVRECVICGKPARPGTLCYAEAGVRVWHQEAPRNEHAEGLLGRPSDPESWWPTDLATSQELPSPEVQTGTPPSTGEGADAGSPDNEGTRTPTCVDLDCIQELGRPHTVDCAFHPESVAGLVRASALSMTVLPWQCGDDPRTQVGGEAS